MAIGTGLRRRSTAVAFTLVELLLTVTLVLLLAGAVIFNFGALGRNARLDEGTTQVETLLRFARAQAASTGRQVKIVFNDGSSPDAGASSSTNQSAVQTSTPISMPSQTSTLLATNVGVQVLWEPEPIDFPGQYQLLPGAALLVEQINDMVRVIARRQPDADRFHTNGLTLEMLLAQLQTQGTNLMVAPDGASTGMAPITCYPDGSSDSAELVLGSVDSEDKRFVVVTLAGLTGRVRHKLISFSEDGSIVTNAPPEQTKSESIDRDSR